MLAIERRNEILEKLQKEKRVVVSELSKVYGVTEETIRRDLDSIASPPVESTRQSWASKSSIIISMEFVIIVRFLFSSFNTLAIKTQNLGIPLLPALEGLRIFQ